MRFRTEKRGLCQDGSGMGYFIKVEPYVARSEAPLNLSTSLLYLRCACGFLSLN